MFFRIGLSLSIIPAFAGDIPKDCMILFSFYRSALYSLLYAPVRQRQDDRDHQLRKYQPRHIIYAPVLTSTKGEQLVSAKVYETIQQLLLPLCTIVLRPSDLPAGPRRHGDANQLASALAYYLSLGESETDARLHAQTYLKALPADYAEGNSRSEELFNQFLTAVERYFYRYADVAFYAEQLNVSARYLGQVTRRNSGRSPKAIIDERIVSEITSLLTSTNRPLKDIAQRLGFSSQAHLSRFFKKHKGMSPTDFQKQR